MCGHADDCDRATQHLATCGVSTCKVRAKYAKKVKCKVCCLHEIVRGFFDAP